LLKIVLFQNFWATKRFHRRTCFNAWPFNSKTTGANLFNPLCMASFDDTGKEHQSSSDQFPAHKAAFRYEVELWIRCKLRFQRQFKSDSNASSSRKKRREFQVWFSVF
jgi:hypothetical protein